MLPLLLHLKMSPVTASATSSVMGFCLVISIAVQIHQDIPYEFVCWMFFLGALGGFVGRRLALYVVELYNRQSFITFALVFMCCIAVVLLLIVAATEKGTFLFKRCVET